MTRLGAWLAVIVIGAGLLVAAGLVLAAVGRVL